MVALTGRHADIAQRFLRARGSRLRGTWCLCTVADRMSRNADPPIPAADVAGWGHGLRAVEALVDWLETGTAPGDVVVVPHLV